VSRTAAYKFVYFGIVFGVASLALWLMFHYQLGMRGIVLLIVALLVPGRVLGFFWRDLLRGLRLLNAKQYAESKKYSQRFLVTLKNRPWLKKLIWLGSGTYSRDPEAMALNNLGAAEIALGEFENAQAHLNAAISTDPLNPLPYFNLGALFTSLENPREAGAWFAKAVNLGYSRTVVDKIISVAQGRFASTDGAGNS
jgi:tetratricopeptide (TPR) repeat protein